MSWHPYSSLKFAKKTSLKYYLEIKKRVSDTIYQGRNVTILTSTHTGPYGFILFIIFTIIF